MCQCENMLEQPVRSARRLLSAAHHVDVRQETLVADGCHEDVFQLCGAEISTQAQQAVENLRVKVDGRVSAQ